MKAECFDAVYYASVAPSSLESLSLLALVFDKIYFPGVHIPLEGVDEKGIEERMKQLAEIKPISQVERVTFARLLWMTRFSAQLKSFCIFPANECGSANPILEEGTDALAVETQTLYFGPPPPNFFPTVTKMHSSAVPGGDHLHLTYPGIWFYAANALLYSRAHGKVLVNDNPYMPVPGSASINPKGDAKALSLMMALEAVRFALPKLKPMEPQALADFKEETQIYVRPFRIAMLKLAKELNAALSGNESIQEVQKQARFLVETTVYPELDELSRIIQQPTSSWFKWAIDLGKSAPDLSIELTSLSLELLMAKLIGRVVGMLSDVRDAQSANEKARQNGLYYLLRVQQNSS